MRSTLAGDADVGEAAATASRAASCGVPSPALGVPGPCVGDTVSALSCAATAAAVAAGTVATGRRCRRPPSAASGGAAAASLSRSAWRNAAITDSSDTAATGAIAAGAVGSFDATDVGVSVVEPAPCGLERASTLARMRACRSSGVILGRGQATSARRWCPRLFIRVVVRVLF